MIHLVTGGSGSGKSAFAENWLLSRNPKEPRYYIAAMKPFGKEAEKRIQRHHALRKGKGFETIERYTNLKNLKLPDGCSVLLECVSNLTANEFFREDGTMGEFALVKREILDGIRSLARQAGELAIVTNEVNSDINGYSEETKGYQRLLGEVNQEIAKMADQVTEVVYGIPVVVKKYEEIME